MGWMFDDKVEGLLTACDKRQLATMLVNSRHVEDALRDYLGRIASIAAATNSPTERELEIGHLARLALETVDE